MKEELEENVVEGLFRAKRKVHRVVITEADTNKQVFNGISDMVGVLFQANGEFKTMFTSTELNDVLGLIELGKLQITKNFNKAE